MIITKKELALLMAVRADATTYRHSALSGIRIEVKDNKCRLCVSDGKRLVIINKEAEHKDFQRTVNAGIFKAICLASKVVEFERFTNRKKRVFNIGLDETEAIREVEGQFPDTDRVFSPKEGDQKSFVVSGNCELQVLRPVGVNINLLKDFIKFADSDLVFRQTESLTPAYCIGDGFTLVIMPVCIKEVK